MFLIDPVPNLMAYLPSFDEVAGVMQEAMKDDIP